MKDIIAERLLMLRHERKLSRKALSDIIGFDDGKYKQYEKDGKSLYDVELLTALADFYHVSLDYLSGRTDNRMDTSLITDEQWELIEKSLVGQHDSTVSYTKNKKTK